MIVLDETRRSLPNGKFCRHLATLWLVCSQSACTVGLAQYYIISDSCP